jgi:cardiolipin synthase (CMP-forming)
VPLFVVELLYFLRTGQEAHRLAALVSFGLAAGLDGVDGYVARHFNQKSELGAILDPLADKLLLVSAVVVLSCNHPAYLGQIPLWLTGIILGRDVLILLGIGLVRLTTGKVVVQPRWMGKIATVLQMTVVLWLLLRWDHGAGGRWYAGWTWGAGICTSLSGVLYLWDGMRQLSAHPVSAAIQK